MYDPQLYPTSPAWLCHLRQPGCAPEVAFDRFTRMAARLLDAPLALIHLFDGERLLLKSCAELPDVSFTVHYPLLEPSLCQHVFASGKPFVVNDTRNHPLVCGYPAVVSGAVLAYVGVPLQGDEGQPLGVLCVIDTAAHDWNADHLAMLSDLAVSVMTEIALRATQAALAERVQFSRSIFDSLAPMIAVLDQTGMIVAVNQAWRAAARRYGVAEECVGVGVNYLRVCEQATGPNATEGPLLAQGIHEVLAGQRTVFVLEYSCHGSGKQHWFIGRVTPFQGQAARGVVLSHEEITARCQAEQALRDSEIHYRLMFEHNPLPMWVYDLESLAFLSVNEAACQHYGYCRDEFLRMTIKDIRPPEEIPGLLYNIAHTPTEGLGSAGVWTHCRKDGSRIAVEIRSHSLPFEGRQARLVMAIDVTDRKRAETKQHETNASLTLLAEQLTRSRDLLRTLFDGLDDGLVLIDCNGTILTTNQAFAALVGQTITGLIGRSWFELCRAAQTPFPGESMLQALHDGRTRRRREHYTRPDGRHCVLDLQALPLISSVGPVDQLIIHVVDSTERLALEALALQSERLTANGKLAATIAHELNTPLQSITNCLYFAGSAAEPQRDRYLTLAREELARIARIVRQMLNLHRPDSGESVVFSLNGLVERVLLLTGSTLAEHGIDAICELAPVLPELCGRADQMTQVLLNLILNATEAMPEGGRLVIRTQPLGLPACGVALEIEDAGIGIAPEIQPRIFEPFFTTKATGSGLGLSISRKIIAQHGGSIGVRSTPNIGSVFRIELPLTELMDEVAS